ncbi:hypothetical protein J4456_03710 [Candidatus Pacearchaeota archaeon]|nr:hypothetical protein [Candidatus Pacearchaeota archaeon]
MKSVTQEDLMGCGIACAAVILNKSYDSTKKLFNKNHAISRGYYCGKIVKVLNRPKKEFYKFAKVNDRNKKFLQENGTIIFTKGNKYPLGYYLIKTRRGWMNPWINFPKLSAESGFQKKLPGKAAWIIFRNI